ncbi:hypothetical protein B9Z55_019299 [Caenorhabditis nigoni]|nr:hypothetical protein B9Z55_019299 [Caenorhabditis nigoni]
MPAPMLRHAISTLVSFPSLQILYHKKAHRKFAVCVTCGKITRRTRTYKTHQDYSRSEVKFDVHRVDNMRIQSIALS